MAEGFFNQPSGKNLEDLGSRYFEELVSRSFFLLSGTNKSCFVMHALINDLACHVAGRICIRLQEDFNDEEQQKVSAYARHLSFTQCRYAISQKFEYLHEVSGLRTFLPLPVDPSEESFISNRVLIDLFPKLKVLRVLSLSGYASVIELPSSIGYLKHLRYLDLSKTWLKWLPESVTSLYNLQTLSLRDCTYLTRLPTSIHNLINLRHLDISCTYALQEMPPGIGSLSNLRTLSRFLVGKSSGLRLKSLGKLFNIEGALSVEELRNVTNAQEAKEAKLKHKSLRALKLQWSSDFDDTRDVYLEQHVLDQMQPPQMLEHLEIVSYGGPKFSSWIEDKPFPKLERIHLSKCTNCTSLPQLGHLPLLKELYIGGMSKVKTLGAEFYLNSSLELPFPSLEILEFLDMPEWKEW
ncbi:UNVERIFIED_CONTAM: putative disease resistance protein [Sesamum latifolium]|uniref:Disease resistance protein n=1 Tax=Sesamum latifolium TaxID=2727402 RepID=A0AAW2XDH6_9LAMI